MLNPGDTIERYEVVELLGVGGHAAVYRMRHTTLDSEHALKLVNLPRDDIRARLIQEGRIQARLRHPNIVPVTDVLDVHGVPALLMPYVDGPDLGRWLERHHPVDLGTALQVFQDIVQAVHSAHESGLVHRDLKPANILMDHHGRKWRPRVTDFGIAKIMDGPDGAVRTRSGIGMGTPAYMAPEQIADAAHVDHRADIFALGCILYELLTGQRLFQASHPLQVVSAISSAEPVDLSGLDRTLPPEVRQVLDGCLEKSRDRRFPDCAMLLDVLGVESLATDPLPSLPPPSPPSLGGGATLTPDVPLTPLAPLVDRTPTAPPPTPTPLAAPTVPDPPTPRPPVFPVLGVLVALIIGTWWLSQSPEAPPPTTVADTTEAPAPKPEAPVAVVEAEPDPPSTPPEAKPTPPTPTPAKAKQPAKPKTGRLKLNAKPWATIRLDGQSRGRTWKTFDDLPVGPHVVVLSSSDDRSHTVTVTVRPDRTVEYCWDFDLGDTCL